MNTRVAKAARRDELVAAHQGKRAAQASRERRIRGLLLSAGLLLLVGAVVSVALLTSRPQNSTETRVAPAFTLQDTAGDTVSLSDYVGSPVILYFSEGAGCQACLLQMREIEKDPDFTAAGITVLPIVMNTREQIQADMDTNGVTTPFLLDDGTVSAAYDTLGKGMHEGLPGHSFVLVDADGVQRWSGEYPSMWLDPSELLDEATSRLDG